MYNTKTCLRCGRCAEVCPLDAITMTTDGPIIDRTRCDLCGECAQTCPPHALKLSAAQMTIAEVMEIVEADRPFYRRSGGGLTVSGGEPLLQSAFTVGLLKAARGAAIGTALETAGYVPWSSVEAVLPWVDYLLYDVKHLDSEIHLTYTGIPNALILDNLRQVAPLARHLIVRVPVIPGFNATDGAIREIAEFTLGLPGVKELHLLPYHRHGQPKYAQLDWNYELDGIDPLTVEREQELAAIVRDVGLECRIRG